MKSALRAFMLSIMLASPLASSANPSGAGVMNAAGDLSGTNYGDSIQLVLAQQSGAHEYILYRAYSGSGPWTVWASVSADARSLVDLRPEAKSKTLCYRVEAKNKAGAIIHKYQLICVPPYNPKQ